MKRKSIFSCPHHKFSHPFSVSTPSQPCHSWHDLLSSKILLKYSVHSGWIQITVLIFKSPFLPKALPSFIVSVFLSWLELLSFTPLFFSHAVPHYFPGSTLICLNVKLWWAKTSSPPVALLKPLNLLWALMNSYFILPRLCLVFLWLSWWGVKVYQVWTTWIVSKPQCGPAELSCMFKGRF